MKKNLLIIPSGPNALFQQWALIQMMTGGISNSWDLVGLLIPLK